MATTMRRPLGNMEAALTLTGEFAPMTMVSVLQLHGPLSAEGVGQAFAELQSRHPLLRATIVGERRGWHFVVDDNDSPPVGVDIAARDTDQTWRDHVERALNSRVATDRAPMARCTLLHDPDGGHHEVILAAHHSIMDATSSSHLLHQLLELTTECAGPDVGRPDDLPDSTDALLPDRVRGMGRARSMLGFMRRQAADEIAYRRHIGDRLPPIQPTAANRVSIGSLDESTTDALVQHARRRRLTMNSVVAAALVHATHRHVYAGESMPLRAITFADLRPFLQPSREANVLACYISMLRHTLEVGPSDDIWAIAARFQQEMRSAMGRDEHLLAAGTAKQLMRMLTKVKRMRMSTTAVSYAGPLGIKPAYGDLDVAEVHGFVSNNRLGPLTNAFVSIFRGRLWWDFGFLDTDLEPTTTEQIATSVIDELERAASA